jgi:parvulin-like peptidyl-prolyl isomerase
MAVSFRVFLLPLCAWAAMAADVRVVDQVIAKVNGDIVTTSEITRIRGEVDAGLRQQGLSGQQLESTLKEREPNLLRDRIDNLLLVQVAKESSISVESDVTKQLAEMQRQAKITDLDEFQNWVTRQSGRTFEDYRQEMRDTLMTQRLLQQEIGPKVSVPRAELQKYYDEHKDAFVREDRVFLSLILVRTEGKAESELPVLEKKAKDLVERARQGERFGELARDNSDDTATVGDNGQLPPLPRAEVDPQIAEIVFKQDKGYVTDPIRRPHGWLILRVDEKHSAGLASFEEVENEIMGKLFEPRFQAAIRPYLTDLRMQAFLEIREGFIDTGAAPDKDTAWKEPAQLKPETVTKEEVSAEVRRRRLLWMVPMPGTQTGRDASTSSSN